MQEARQSQQYAHGQNGAAAQAAQPQEGAEDEGGIMETVVLPVLDSVRACAHVISFWSLRQRILARLVLTSRSLQIHDRVTNPTARQSILRFRAAIEQIEREVPGLINVFISEVVDSVEASLRSLDSRAFVSSLELTRPAATARGRRLDPRVFPLRHASPCTTLDTTIASVRIIPSLSRIPSSSFRLLPHLPTPDTPSPPVDTCISPPSNVVRPPPLIPFASLRVERRQRCGSSRRLDWIPLATLSCLCMPLAAPQRDTRRQPIAHRRVARRRACRAFTGLVSLVLVALALFALARLLLSSNTMSKVSLAFSRPRRALDGSRGGPHIRFISNEVEEGVAALGGRFGVWQSF